MNIKANKSEASPVRVGSKVEAHHYQSGQWRPAKVLSYTPANDSVGAGYYVQWLDVDTKDFSKSQTAWVTAATLQE